jgi:nuclear GTP-binding protein
VVDQKKLELFREELQKTEGNPYQFVLKKGKVPYGLLRDNFANAKVNLLSVESFQDTFGPKKKRKRPNLGAYEYEALLEKIEQKTGTVLFLFLFFNFIQFSFQFHPFLFVF